MNRTVLCILVVFTGVCGVVHCTKVKHDAKPTLPLLLKFPAKPGKFIDIVQKVMGLDCERLGIFLLEDDDGSMVSSIKQSKHFQSEAICVEILNKWLRGGGHWPVTWETFVENLRNVDLNYVADVIEKAYGGPTQARHDGGGFEQHRYDNLKIKARHLRRRTVLRLRRKINDFWLLYEATADVGNWIALCSALGGGQLESKIEELKFTSMDVSSKKRDCLKAFYDLGDVYWEEVVDVVSSYPIDNARLASKIAKEHGVDFRPRGSKDEL